MDWRSLKIINISTVLVILLIIILEKLFLPIYGSIGSSIAGVLFWFVLYLNLRKSILDFIVAHRNSKIQIDQEREERLNRIKYCVFILGLFISVLSIVFAWIYMRDQFIWAVFFVFGVMLLAAFHNLFITVTYLIAKKPLINFSKLSILFIFYFLAIIFMWIYMRDQFVYSVILLLFILFMGVLINARDAVNILKIINDKPVDLKKERLIKIINYLPVIAIITLVVIIYLRINFYFAYILLLNLIRPLILLMIIANSWKFISDIS